MPFSTPAYIFLFLPAVGLVYFLLSRGHRPAAGRAWLVGASLFFYGYAAPAHLPLLVFSVLVNFAAGNLMERSRDNRRRILIAGIVFNLALLGVFKYAGFFLGNLNRLTGNAFRPPGWTLPLAISFYTFQQIAYLVDRHNTRAGRSTLLDYGFFVTFFPQLIAGPIVRFREIMPQVLQPGASRVSATSTATGVFVFSVGLFKKMIIADLFKLWADAGFAARGIPGFFDAWGAALSYTFQLYYDFSGYSDMAIGAALLFNIRLPVNFDSPYRAGSIQDFWRRWHVTLSRWLRDYLYIPLGGNRRGAARTLVNLWLTFLLAGLWHGAGWTFVVWGALHGAALCCHRLWRLRGLKMPATAGWLLTFVFVTVAWVFFRAPDTTTAGRLLAGMAGLHSLSPAALDGLFAPLAFSDLLHGRVLIDHLLARPNPVWAVAFALVALLAPNSMQMIGFVPYDGTWRFRSDTKTAVLTAALLFVSFMGFLGNVVPAEFIYFNF